MTTPRDVQPHFAPRLASTYKGTYGHVGIVAGSQGRSNVSHGCINLSTDRAAWFFNFSQPGDVVEVKNSIGPTLSSVDGDIYDWAVPWEKWTAGSALK